MSRSLYIVLSRSPCAVFVIERKLSFLNSIAGRNKHLEARRSYHTHYLKLLIDKNKLNSARVNFYKGLLLIVIFVFSFPIGGPYAAFGGRDASRGLATFSVTSNDNAEYDDLSDLTPMEMESVREWEAQFKGKDNSIEIEEFLTFLRFIFAEKYILVGRLLKPGEKPTNYSDEDEDTPNESTPTGDNATTTTSTSTSTATKEETPAAAPSSPKKTVDSSSSGDAKLIDFTTETSPATTGEVPSKAEDLKTGGDE